MSVDIEKLAEADLLPTLGTGDWEIALPEKYNPLIVPVKWRLERCAEAADTFVRWVINGISISIVHDSDPPWDQSGESRSRRVDPDELLTRYDTFQEWMEDEYTGQSRASYMSGMGLFWDNYGDAIKEMLTDATTELVKDHLRAQFGDVDDDNWWDEVWEDLTWIQSVLELALYQMVSRVKTADAWRDFAGPVMADLEAERRRVEEQSRQNAIVLKMIRKFWLDHFSDVGQQRIEKPDFRAFDLENRIREALADADPQIVEGVIQFGLPGYFSNSVGFEVQQIARKISLADRHIHDELLQSSSDSEPSEPPLVNL
jgi:hypothetical protein